MIRFRILRSTWMLSFLFYLLVLILVYMNLPEISRLPALGTFGSENVSKSNTFYIALGSFFLINLLILLMVKMIDLNRTKRFYFTQSWIYGLGATVNLFWTILVFYLLHYNNIQVTSDGFASFLLYLGPSILLLWLIYLGVNYKKVWYEWRP